MEVSKIRIPGFNEFKALSFAYFRQSSETRELDAPTGSRAIGLERAGCSLVGEDNASATAAPDAICTIANSAAADEA